MSSTSLLGDALLLDEVAETEGVISWQIGSATAPPNLGIKS